MTGETDRQRHERISQSLDRVQAEIRGLIARLSNESVDEEEPYSLPAYGELKSLIDEREKVIESLVATETEILVRIGLPGDPQQIGSIDVADVAQVGGAEPADEL